MGIDCYPRSPFNTRLYKWLDRDITHLRYKKAVVVRSSRDGYTRMSA